MNGGRRRDRTSVRLSTQPRRSRSVHSHSASLPAEADRLERSFAASKAAVLPLNDAPKIGGHGWTRTSTDRALNAVTLPIGLHARRMVPPAGLEPALSRLSDARLCRIGLRRRGGHGGTRTPTDPVLSRVPLPIGLRGRHGGEDRDRTCLRVTARVFETRVPPLGLPLRTIQLRGKTGTTLSATAMSGDSSVVTGRKVVGRDGP